jgi:hypothetical protein
VGVSLRALAVLAGSIRLARPSARGPRLIVFVRRMSLERRTFDVGFLLVTGREGPSGEALARRFAASFAVADGLVLARRVGGFARLRHV